MKSSVTSNDNEVRELKAKIKNKETDINSLRNKIDKAVNELLEEELVDGVKKALRDKINKMTEETEKAGSEVIELESRIESLKSEMLSPNDYSYIIENTVTIIKKIDDPKKRQELVRGIVKEITIENKHIKDIHFRFSKNSKIGGDTQNRITNNSGQRTEASSSKEPDAFFLFVLYPHYFLGS